MTKPTILTPQLSVASDAVLGGAVTDREVLYRLADRGYHIRLLLPEGEQCRDHECVQTTFIPRNWLLTRSYTINFFFLKEITRILNTEHIDIVRVHAPYSIGLGCALLKIARKLPPLWYSYLHCEDRLDWRMLDSLLPRMVDGITVLSEDTLSDLTARCRGVLTKPYQITPLGADQAIFYKQHALPVLPEGMSIDWSRPIVLFVGSLIRRKGIEALCAMWPEIAAQCSAAQLVIIGQGPEERRLRSLIAHQEGVFHIRSASQTELTRWYSRARVFAFPTLREGYGMVIAEAMSCGCPVVSYDVGGVRRLIEHNSTGYCLRPGDKDLFAEKVLHLLRDEETYQAFSSAAEQFAREHCSWDSAIDQVEIFIEELLAYKKSETRNTKLSTDQKSKIAMTKTVRRSLLP